MFCESNFKNLSNVKPFPDPFDLKTGSKTKPAHIYFRFLQNRCI